MALQYITKDILKRTSGEALLDLPYDTSFIAGYDNLMVASDVAVQTYGKIIMARSGDFVGEVGSLETHCTGAVLICDITKNDSTIYSTKPEFNVNTSTLTPGVMSTTSFVSGDRISFKVTQVGNSTAGQGLCFNLKCKV